MKESKYTKLIDNAHYCPRCRQDWLVWDRKDHSYICKRCHLHFLVLAEERKPRFTIDMHSEFRKTAPAQPGRTTPWKRST